MTSPLRQQTAAARAALLELHRVLLETVRLEHERDHGRLGNAEMLRLVAFDPARRSGADDDEVVGGSAVFHGQSLAPSRKGSKRVPTAPSGHRARFLFME